MHKDCIKLGNILPSQHRVGIVYGMGGVFPTFLENHGKVFLTLIAIRYDKRNQRSKVSVRGEETLATGIIQADGTR